MIRNIKNMTTIKYGNPQSIPDPLLTVLIPLCCPSFFLEELLRSLRIQKHTQFRWEIVIVDGMCDKENSSYIQEIVRKVDNNRIIYYCVKEQQNKIDTVNIGFGISRGKWICHVEEDFILQKDAVFRMGELISKVSKSGSGEGAAISLCHITLRKHKNVEDVMQGISKREQLLYKQNRDIALRKLDFRHIVVYGSIGGAYEKKCSLYLKNAILRQGGFDSEYSLIADDVLLAELEKNYNVYTASDTYGFYITLGCKYNTKEEVLKAAELWKNYVEQYMRDLSFSERQIRKKTKLFYYRYIKNLILSHKSLNLSISDFEYLLHERPGIVQYNTYYIFTTRRFEKAWKWE